MCFVIQFASSGTMGFWSWEPWPRTPVSKVAVIMTVDSIVTRASACFYLESGWVIRAI